MGAEFSVRAKAETRCYKGVAAQDGVGGDQLNPLILPEVVEKIVSFLPVEDLKSARLVNHLWFHSSRTVWGSNAMIRFRDFDAIKDFAHQVAVTRQVLPFHARNWEFQDDTVTTLMGTKGTCQQHIIAPFWRHVRCLKFSDWMKKLVRTGSLVPVKGSAVHVTEMFKLCENLTHLVIHFPILIEMRGTVLGPYQFPELECLTRFDVYWQGKKWKPDLTQDPEKIIAENLRAANDGQSVPVMKSGGFHLVLRILDYSPNLTHFSVNSGTLITTQVETWLLQMLFRDTVELPKLKDLHFSVPLQREICEGLQARPWGLRTLHLRTLPGFGNGNHFPARELHTMIASFRDTLQHLELVFLGKGDFSYNFLSGAELYNLRSLEMWGFTGTSYEFLTEMKKLERAVIGVTDGGSFKQLKEFFQVTPMAHLKLELKTVEDFHARMNRGPGSRIKTLNI